MHLERLLGDGALHEDVAVGAERGEVGAAERRQQRRERRVEPLAVEIGRDRERALLPLLLLLGLAQLAQFLLLPCVERLPHLAAHLVTQLGTQRRHELRRGDARGARRDAQAGCLDLLAVHGQHAAGGYHVGVKALQGAHATVDEALGVLDRLPWLDSNFDEGLGEVARGRSPFAPLRSGKLRFSLPPSALRLLCLECRCDGSGRDQAAVSTLHNRIRAAAA